MPLVAAEDVQIQCRACRDTFPGVPQYTSHLRKSVSPECSGHGYDIEVPDSLGPAPSDPPEAAATGSDDAPTATPASPAPAATNGQRADEDDGAGALQPGGGGTNKAGLPEPSVTLEKLRLPVIIRTMYDVFRTHLGFEGTFDDFIVQMLYDHLLIMGLKPGAIRVSLLTSRSNGATDA